MARKNAPTITGSLLTTIARTVGVTAGMIVNKTTELTEVAAHAAGATIKQASAKRVPAPKKRAPAKKRATKKKSMPKKRTKGA